MADQQQVATFTNTCRLTEQIDNYKNIFMTHITASLQSCLHEVRHAVTSAGVAEVQAAMQNWDANTASIEAFSTSQSVVGMGKMVRALNKASPWSCRDEALCGELLRSACRAGVSGCAIVATPERVPGFGASACLRCTFGLESSMQ
jgi:hypothetical protein